MNCCKNTLETSINGHLDCLKYLLDNNISKWDEAITYHAAYHGYLDILQYAQEKKFTFHPLTTACAEYGGIECLQYCLKHNHPWQYDYQYAYRSVLLENITKTLLLNDPWWTSYILNLDLSKDTDSTRQFKELKEKTQERIDIRNKLVDVLGNKFLIKDIVMYDLAKYI